MKADSNQAGRLPSVFDIVKDYMIEKGFPEHYIKITDVDLKFHVWTLCSLDYNEQLYFLPFSSNKATEIDPRKPDFFTKLDVVLEPPVNSPFRNYWEARPGLLPPTWLQAYGETADLSSNSR